MSDERSPTASTSVNNLIGFGIHERGPDGTFRYQGVIEGEPAPGVYLVMQLDWVLGVDAFYVILTAADLATRHPNGRARFQLYSNTDAMNEYFVRHESSSVGAI